MPPKRTEVTYTTALSRWRRQGAVRIISVLDTPLATIPMQFLEQGGDNTWSYIQFIISLIIVEDAGHPGGFYTLENEPVVLTSVPAAGKFRFVEYGESCLYSTVCLPN
jgi:hypothetical protein